MATEKEGASSSGGNPEKNIGIGRDSVGSVSIIGDGNVVHQFFIDRSSLTEPEYSKLLESMREAIASKDSSPYGIEGTTLHNLPYPQNPFFTGRKGILADLHASLTDSGSSTALSQPQAISGLGGIGKTQIACEYAHRHINDYQGVFWVTAETDSSIVSGYGEIAHLLKLQERDKQDLEVVVGAVRSWLQTHQGWLLIFDNADEPGIACKYLPTSHEGRVLLTSRAAAFGKLAQALEVNEMAGDEAIDFLLTRSGFVDPNEDDRNGAGNICRELGCLPLAVDHAGAFIEQTGCRLVDYLESFKAKGVDILGDPDYAAADYQLESGVLRTVATTWLMAIEEVREKNRAAEDILKLSAFLAPEGILLELLRSGSDSFEGPLKEVVTDSYELDKSLGALQSYSLIKRRQGSDQYSMHRLVQAVIRDGLSEEERRVQVETDITCAATALPDVSDYRNWPICDTIVPHVLALVEHAGALRLATEEYASLLSRIGDYLYQRADYVRTEQLSLGSLEIREIVLGPKHEATAASLNNLARLYKTQGEFEKAEPLFRRLLKIVEEVLGPKHPDTATSLNNLATVYDDQGMYDRAEPLYLRALEVREEVLGPKHPDTAQSLNNLAFFHKTRGQYDKAEPLYLRALEIKKEVLGPKHPSVATSLNNLAVLYNVQGKYGKAEPLHRRVLEIDEAIYGSNHPEVATDLNNLAEFYRAQGKPDKAEPLYLRALEIMEDVFGPKHPNTAATLSNLALLHCDQGIYDKAEPLCLRALEIDEAIYGSDHPSVATKLANLAQLYRGQGKHSKAEPLWLRALEIDQAVYGPDHPDVAIGLHHLGTMLYKMGRKREGIEMVRRAYRIFSTALGPDHPNTEAVRAYLEAWGVEPE